MENGLPWNNKDFDRIIRLFELEKAWDYFQLYNISKFKYSYHGEVHAMNGCCTIFKLCRNENLSMSWTREILLAYIFHDFNYVAGASFSKDEAGNMTTQNPDYDDVNIAQAIEAVRTYLDQDIDNPSICRVGTKEDFTDAVVALIEHTRWPIKEDKFGPREEWTIDHQIILDADHSMVLYDNYVNLITALFTHELNCSEFLQPSLDWLEQVSFNSVWLTSQWEKRKPLLREIIKSTFPNPDRPLRKIESQVDVEPCEEKVARELQDFEWYKAAHANYICTWNAPPKYP